VTHEQPNHDDREFLISRYIDGDLDNTARRELESTLRDDPELARALESYRRTDALIRSLEEFGPKLDWEQFAAEVRRRCALVDARKRRTLIHRVYAPLATAAVIALMCTAYLMFPRELTGPATPLPKVLVQLNRPAGGTNTWQTHRVVMVRANRTPPPGFSDARPSGGRYAIAAAGANSFGHPGETEETSPFF